MIEDEDVFSAVTVDGYDGMFPAVRHREDVGCVGGVTFTSDMFGGK